MLLFADGAFQAEDDFLGNLGLFLKDGFSLTTVAALLAIVAAFALGVQRGLTGGVLADLVGSVLATFFRSAEGLAGLWNVDLQWGRRGSRD